MVWILANSHNFYKDNVFSEYEIIAYINLLNNLYKTITKPLFVTEFDV